MRAILEKPYVVLGIDPGLSGAVARVGRGMIEVRCDFKILADITIAIEQSCGDNLPRHAAIEMVGARPGQGVCSMFSFGKATGVAFGSLFSVQLRRMSYHPLEIDEIHPLKWQNWARRELKMEKKAPFDSRLICQTLFPDYAAYFRRKKDHNSADAVLLALYKLAQL